jgi:hypothetical protein
VPNIPSPNPKPGSSGGIPDTGRVVVVVPPGGTVVVLVVVVMVVVVAGGVVVVVGAVVVVVVVGGAIVVVVVLVVVVGGGSTVNEAAADSSNSPPPQKLQAEMRMPVPGAAPTGTVNVTEKKPFPSTVQSARTTSSKEIRHGGNPGVQPIPSTVIEVMPAIPDVGFTVSEAAWAGPGGVTRATSRPNAPTRASLRSALIRRR